MPPVFRLKAETCNRFMPRARSSLFIAKSKTPFSDE